MKHVFDASWRWRRAKRMALTNMPVCRQVARRVVYRPRTHQGMARGVTVASTSVVCVLCHELISTREERRLIPLDEYVDRSYERGSQASIRYGRDRYAHLYERD